MTHLLQVENVCLSFGGVRAANNVNVHINKGEFFAIVGQNGAGKSTLLNICTGYLKPESGRISFDGKDITGVPPRRIAHMGIARAFQHPQIFIRQTVIENMAFAVSCASQAFWRPRNMLRDKPVMARAREILELCRLDDVAHEAAEHLSAGTRKLLDVAMALALNPRLLLLDEPTSGVSSEDKNRIMTTLVDALREKNVTAAFVEHDMEVVERFADRVGVWANGQMMFCGAMADAVQDKEIAGLFL